MIEDFTADQGSLSGKVQSLPGFGGFVKTAVSTGASRDSTSSLTMVLFVLVNVLGAVALLLPAIWTAYSVSDMSSFGRGYTDLDNAIRAEENLKVAISLALYIAITLFS